MEELKTYKCTKIVQAKLMGRKTAEQLGLVRDNTGVNERGYHVVYDNGNYESWTPAEPFERGYELQDTETSVDFETEEVPENGNFTRSVSKTA